MQRSFVLPKTFAALGAVLALGGCRPSAESSAPPSSSTPSTPTASASAAASGTAALPAATASAASAPGTDAQTGQRTDGTGSAAPAGTPR